METLKKNILVAPLNWGLGHAARCIPIIRALEQNGYTPIVASDGAALQLLQKEFPHLRMLALPSYEIEYTEKEEDLKWKLLKNSPKMVAAIIKEKRLIKKWIAEFNVKGIISDNRLGVYSKKIPSVFITHQLNVLSGQTTWISTTLHHFFIRKFRECWVPDFEEKPNLTGKLGHLKKTRLKLKYMGPLSRLEKRNLPQKYDLMILLSGPEPQRTLLEEKLKAEIRTFDGPVIFVGGLLEPEQKITTVGNVTYYNFMTATEVETALNESAMVLSRSGYTTVMDLAKLQKKAFFIPTPGQLEQKYLAKKLKRNGFVPFAQQDDFVMGNLLEVALYKGLPELRKEVNWKALFVLFEGK